MSFLQLAAEKKTSFFGGHIKPIFGPSYSIRVLEFNYLQFYKLYC